MMTLLLIVYGLVSIRSDDSPSAKGPKQPELAKELAAMVKADQDARFKMIKLMNEAKGDAGSAAKRQADAPEFKAVFEIDQRNRARMKEIVKEHGWPSFTLVGKEGAFNAWLLVQHSDEDKPFQKECLELMRVAAAKGEASKRELAYLVDRVLVGEGKKQLYGTQTELKDGKAVPKPVEDPENLDKRRAEAGMPTMKEYLKQVEAMYVPKPAAEKTDK